MNMQKFTKVPQAPRLTKQKSHEGQPVLSKHKPSWLSGYPDSRGHFVSDQRAFLPNRFQNYRSIFMIDIA
ncbi:MAG: hypothetical protein LBQ88_20370 [Treponema sp.]|jgi:hypothetical protein|nr:hypothetical protein [Treponema sp.]